MYMMQVFGIPRNTLTYAVMITIISLMGLASVLIINFFHLMKKNPNNMGGLGFQCWHEGHHKKIQRYMTAYS
ncbi:hypothetical protein ABE28_003975 [Peribacillus muralis]|uniref:Uncharacterized protein n=1 Tax=Peribacillus muralis TaxID=264697 RepID=A0A1B3XJW1_9BACI|nr:hypothetical protein [Peribacillus muralis]AOH53499.1 hypothetical protein ABE28_003975 [Peribacillus muralis]